MCVCGVLKGGGGFGGGGGPWVVVLHMVPQRHMYCTMCDSQDVARHSAGPQTVVPSVLLVCGGASIGPQQSWVHMAPA